MKETAKYKFITMVLGIVVALLIAFSLWITPAGKEVSSRRGTPASHFLKTGKAAKITTSIQVPSNLINASAECLITLKHFLVRSED